MAFRPSRLFILGCVACALLEVSTASVHTQTTQTPTTIYTLTDLGPNTRANAINAFGQIVGSSSNPNPTNPFDRTAFLYWNGTFTTLGSVMRLVSMPVGKSSAGGSNTTPVREVGRDLGHTAV